MAALLSTSAPISATALAPTSGALPEVAESAQPAGATASKPVAALVAIRSNLANGKIRIRIAALGSRAQVKYQTARGKKRTVNLKLRNGRATIVLPVGAQAIQVRSRATKSLSASPWISPADKAPDTVGIPQGLSYWVSADSILVLQRDGNTASLVESNGFDGYCATGQLTGSIWTVKRDFADADGIVTEKYLVQFHDPQLFLTPDREFSWTAGTLEQANQTLRTLNEYADPAANTLIAKCGFQSRRWR